MPSKPSVILGISPGTRFMGYAVMSEGELIDWGIKSFNGKWSNSKGNKILETIQKMISAYQPSAVVVKVNQTPVTSKNLEMIYSEIKNYTKPNRLNLFFISIKDLKRTCFEVKNKQEMVEYLRQRFPETDKNFQRNAAGPNIRAFEAIAAIISIS